MSKVSEKRQVLIVLLSAFLLLASSCTTYIPPVEEPEPLPPTPTNQPPYALFSVSNPHPCSYYPGVFEGDPVTFDASASRDLDGEIVSYKWFFRSPLCLISASGVIVVQTFSVVGHYAAELTVLDDQGASDTNTYPFTVYDSRCSRCGGEGNGEDN